MIIYTLEPRSALCFQRKKILNLSGLLALTTIHKHQSKRKAALEMGISVDTLNRHIDYLEDFFKTKLVKNTTKGCALTPKGVSIANTVQDAQNILDTIYQEEEEDHTPTDKYKGEVKIILPLAVSTNLLPFDALDFCDTYPDIRLCSFGVEDSFATENEDADLCIYTKRPENLDRYTLLYEKEISLGLFASPHYINRFGYPKDIDDLCENHRLVHKIGSERIINGWKEIFDRSKQIYYKTNSTYSMMQVVRYGVGLGIMPMRFKDEGFIWVDNIISDAKVTFYLVANKKSITLPRVKAVAEYYTTLMSRM